MSSNGASRGCGPPCVLKRLFLAPCLLLGAEAAGQGPASSAEASLAEVVVTAAPLRRAAVATVQPSSVLSGEALRRAGEASLGESLARLPGVASSYYGPIASRPLIRGFGGYRVQILEDGLPSMDASSVSDDHSVPLDSALAKQIEVLRGPAALLYGSQAAAGVVNVVTNRLPERAPTEASSGALDLRADRALGQRAIAGEFSTRRGAFFGHLDAHRSETEDLRVAVAPGRVANSSSTNRGGVLSGGWFGDAASVGLAIGATESRYGLPSEEKAFIDLERTRIDLRGRGSLNFAGFEAISLRAAATDYEHTEFEEPGEAGTTFVNEQIEARLMLERLAVGLDTQAVLGLQFGDQDFAALGEEAFVPPSRTRTVALFGSVERAFGERLVLEAGARLDEQSLQADSADEGARTDSGLSVSLGSIWRTPRGYALALRLARTERHPQATELYADGFHAALARIEIGDADLQPEIGHSLDATLRGGNDQLSWTLGAYLNRYLDFIYPEPTGEFEEAGHGHDEHGDAAEEYPVFAFRQADAELRGAELELAWRGIEGSDGGRFGAALHGDIVRGRLRNGGDLPAIPAWRIGLGLEYERRAWRVGVDYRRIGSQRRVTAFETPTDGFADLGFDLSYRSQSRGTRLLVFLRGSNLLDEDGRVHSSALKDIVPVPGRSLRLGVRLELGGR